MNIDQIGDIRHGAAATSFLFLKALQNFMNIHRI
jgi:hypothetical protein